MRRNILLTPGPATTTDTVKKALVVPDICPREKDFSKLIQSIRHDLVNIAGGDEDYTCILFASSGTGAMEACMGSVIPVAGVTSNIEKFALILSNGIYGARFSSITGALGIKQIQLSHPPGEPLDIKRLKNVLFDIHDDIGAVFMTHHETTTGILNDIKEISKITKSYKISLVVDCVSSFGAVPLDIKKCGADFIMSTSNKCLQGMPGISFVICKKEVLNHLSWNARSYYFDLEAQYRFFEEHGQFRFTPPVQVLYALRKAIDELLTEGIENRYERYAKNYCFLVDEMHARGFKSYLAPQTPRSFLMETFVQPPNFDFKTFHDKLYKKGFTVYPGVTTEKTFRLGSMGDLHKEDVEDFLKAVDKVV